MSASESLVHSFIIVVVAVLALRSWELEADRAARAPLARLAHHGSILALLALLLILGACGDNLTTPPELVGPDAAVDAECIPPGDAAADSCCRFAPDEKAIGSCFATTLPPGTCGVIACERVDCTFLRVNACGAGQP